MSDQQHEAWPTAAMFAAGDREISYQLVVLNRPTARGIWNAMRVADQEPWVDRSMGLEDAAIAQAFRELVDDEMWADSNAWSASFRRIKDRAREIAARLKQRRGEE